MEGSTAVRRSNGQSFEALEQRVYNVEQGLQSINNGISALSAKIDERSRTSWPTLASFATVLVVVMGALGTLALRPNDAAVERHERQILQLYDFYITGLKDEIKFLKGRP